MILQSYKNRAYHNDDVFYQTECDYDFAQVTLGLPDLKYCDVCGFASEDIDEVRHHYRINENHKGDVSTVDKAPESEKLSFEPDNNPGRDAEFSTKMTLRYNVDSVSEEPDIVTIDALMNLKNFHDENIYGRIAQYIRHLAENIHAAYSDRTQAVETDYLHTSMKRFVDNMAEQDRGTIKAMMKANGFNYYLLVKDNPGHQFVLFGPNHVRYLQGYKESEISIIGDEKESYGYFTKSEVNDFKESEFDRLRIEEESEYNKEVIACRSDHPESIPVTIKGSLHERPNRNTRSITIPEPKKEGV